MSDNDPFFENNFQDSYNLIIAVLSCRASGTLNLISPLSKILPCLRHLCFFRLHIPIIQYAESEQGRKNRREQI